MTYVAYKNAFIREMQFWSHCYTVVSYQALFRLSVYKIPAEYLLVQKMFDFARYATLVPRLLCLKKLVGLIVFEIDIFDICLNNICHIVFSLYLARRYLGEH